jgi:hypothetical protein
MSSDARAEARIVELMQRLPRDVAVTEDLWLRIAASIDNPADEAIRRLPRDIGVTRDLWPNIKAQLQRGTAVGRTMPANRPQRFSALAAVGLVAVVMLGVLVSAQFRQIADARYFFDDAVRLPVQVSNVFERFENALPGTRAAAVRESALEIRRDLIMTRSERFRIEQALAGTSNDRNLRAQWRHVFVAELRLIDVAQHLGNFELSRREI